MKTGSSFETNDSTALPLPGKSVSAEDLADFVAALESRSRDDAISVAGHARTRGASVRTLITDLLAPAQQQIGQLWMVGKWSVSQEHSATAIVEQVLDELRRTEPRSGDRGHVAVACAHGEFHTLPARMLSAYLETDGWRVDFLGASVNRDALVAALSDRRPLALLVSCSLYSSLRGAMEAFGVAHGVGIPALAGGSGFGSDSSHAEALGADAWAASPAQIGTILDAWSASRPFLARPLVPLFGDHVELVVQRRELLDAAMSADGASTANPTLRDELGQVIDYMVASLLVKDPSVFTSLLTWRREASAANDLGLDEFHAGLANLALAIPASLSSARELLVSVEEARAGD